MHTLLVDQQHFLPRFSLVDILIPMCRRGNGGLERSDHPTHCHTAGSGSHSNSGHLSPRPATKAPHDHQALEQNLLQDSQLEKKCSCFTRETGPQAEEVPQKIPRGSKDIRLATTTRGWSLGCGVQVNKGPSTPPTCHTTHTLSTHNQPKGVSEQNKASFIGHKLNSC